MGTVSKFETERRLLDPSNATLDGQARVNAEIFTAVEILGRKLERVEEERDRLARRLALIESAATVDEKTGRLYLPVAMHPETPPVQQYSIPRWMIPATLMSSVVALFALGLVLFRAPAPALTRDQVALLESLKNTQFTQLSPDSTGWKSLETEEPRQSAAATPAVTPAPAVSQPQPVISSVQPSLPSAPPPAPQTAGAPPAQLPSPAELAKLEQTAVQPVEASTPASSTAPVKLTPPPAMAETNPQNVLIPGEDDIPEKTPAKTAEETTVPAQDDTAVKTVVPQSAGAGGIAPDAALPKKLALLQKRAFEGIPAAQHDLATLYAAGSLVPQDYHRATFWFTKAADGGVANANYNMGVIYHQGLGVPVNMPKALEWYEKAAELGHPEAMYNLGIAYIEGIGTKVDIDKGVSYFKRAAKAGVVQAAYNLGVLYESNFIGPIDTKKAIEWYSVAAKDGHKGARDALARLQANGTAMADSGADSGDQALTLADKIEPSTGGDEETGEGDSSPVTEAAPLPKPRTLLSDIQRLLIKQGALPGQPDGVLSQQTEDAIRASEKKLGMTEDGQPSQELLEKLLQAPPTEDKQFP